MDIKSLECYIAVVECGSITKAAQKLYISQPPLSLRIKLLEEELGVTLLERGPRNIRLTHAGEILYQRAQDIISMKNRAVKEMLLLHSEGNDSLRIGIASSCSNLVLSGIVSQLVKQCPNLNYELFEENTYTLLDSIKSDMVDIALIRTPFQAEKSMQVMKLSAEYIVAVGAHKFFPALDLEYITAEQLAGVPLITYRRWHSIICEAFTSAQVSPFFRCVNDDARTSLLWAKRGLGVALIPQSICLGVPDLFQCPFGQPPLMSTICTVWKKNPADHQPLSCLLRLLHENYGT